MKEATGIWKEVDDFVKSNYIPLHMMLEVSRRCNINCVHCYNIKDKAHLSYKQIDDIFKQLREAGTLFLTLTGGEFFARTDACDILRLARSYGFDIRLITNGTMITKVVAQVLHDVNMLEVGVSVLGSTAEVHDALARHPGAFDRTLAGIKNCIEAKVPVHIKCTLMNENYHQFRGVIDLAKSLGIVFMIDPIVTPRDDGDVVNLKYRLKEEHLEDFYMCQFKELGDEVQEGEPAEKEKGLPCDAGTGFGSISASGDVYPCVQLPKAVGNVFKGRFKDIWQQASFLNKLRQATKKECSDCSSCAGLSYLETGDPFGPSSISSKIKEYHDKYEAQKKAESII